MKRKKIAIIGAGQIGGVVAQLAGLKMLGDIVLYDIVEGMPQGKALDISHMAPIFDVDFKIKGTNDISDIKDADVCIVTSGLPRKPGMSRDDLLKVNSDIVTKVGAGIKEYAPNSFVIVTTNPLDAMAYQMQKVTGFDPSRVVGMAGVLDTGRYRSFLAEELNVSVASVSAFVLGGHGNDMVPVRSYTNVAGIPIEAMLPKDKIEAIEKRVRGAGGEVVALLKTGSAFVSPAAACIEMAESFLKDQKKVLPCAALCKGEYGINNLYIGVPVIIGSSGIEKIIEIELNDQEKEELKVSVAGVQSLVDVL